MDKVRTLIFEIIIAAAVVGVIVAKYPDALLVWVPFLLLLVFWHGMWLLADAIGRKGWVRSRNRMTYVGVFLVGGVLSVLWFWGSNAGLRALAREQKQLEPPPSKPVDGTSKFIPSEEISPKQIPAEPVLARKAPESEAGKPLSDAPKPKDSSPASPNDLRGETIVLSQAYGNLRERANGLADALSEFTAHRNDQLKWPPYNGDATVNNGQWFADTDREYRDQYQSKIEKLYDEFVQLHFMHGGLAYILNDDKLTQAAIVRGDYAADLKRDPRSHFLTDMKVETIDDIAKAFRELANQLPK